MKQVIRFLEKRGTMKYYLCICPTCKKEYVQSTHELKTYKECKQCANANPETKERCRMTTYFRKSPNKGRKYDKMPKNIEVQTDRGYPRYMANFMIKGKRWRSPITRNLQEAIEWKEKKLAELKALKEDKK